MVIDVDHRRSIEAGDAGPVERAALHDRARRRSARRPREPPECRSTAGNGCRKCGGTASMTTSASLPKRAERQRHSDRRPDGVAVGPLMRRQDETLPGSDVRGRCDRDQLTLRLLVVRRGGLRLDLSLARGFLFVNLAEDLLDPILRRHRLVEEELHFRRAAERHPRAQQTPDVRRGARQRFRRLLPLRRVAHRRPVDAGERQIRRDLDPRDGDQPDAQGRPLQSRGSG